MVLVDERFPCMLPVQHHRSIRSTLCLRESECPLLWTWRGNPTPQVRLETPPSEQGESREAARTLCWPTARGAQQAVQYFCRLLVDGPLSPEPTYCPHRHYIVSLRCSHVRSEQALDKVAAAVEKVVRAHALPELKRVVLFHSMRGEISSKERARSILE